MSPTEDSPTWDHTHREEFLVLPFTVCWKTPHTSLFCL